MSLSMFRSLRTTTRRPRWSAPRLEALEDRRVMATFMPLASAADGTPNSLREDVISADENLQDNTIILQAGIYQLTVPNSAVQENGAAEGDLDLTPSGHTITIQGQGAGSTIIDGGQLDRVFQVAKGVNVVLEGLTIQNGIARDSGLAGTLPYTTFSAGGGILNSGTLELDGVIVESCVAQAGPGGANGIQGRVGFVADGGGIFNDGTLTINQSIIRDNVAEGGGGGNGGSSNAAPGATGGNGGEADGGGIYNEATLTVRQSTIDGNSAYGGPGGVGGIGPAGAGQAGGSGGQAFGGGLYVDFFSPQTLIIDSTIANNTATGGVGGTGGQGAGAGAEGGGGGSGGSAEGGGIAAVYSFSLYNSTIAANQAIGSSAGPGGPGVSGATQGPTGYVGPAFAGGIWAPSDPGSTGPVSSFSTIIALNTSAPFGLAGSPDDVEANFASATNTLLGFGDGATLPSSGSTVLIGIDPQLGPLQDNGGPTPTMALLPGSPAIDAGSNPLGLTTDQRGYSPRVVGTAADIGAYEVGADAPSSGGGGGGTGTVHIKATVIKVKGHKEVRVTDAATGAVKFTVFPFGKAYHGTYLITTADVDGDGIDDLIVRRARGRHKFITKIFSGINGSPLPSNLA
jgi:hypothetical protein